MKKLISYLLVSTMAIGSLTACSNSNQQTTTQTSDEDKLNIICTIFPEYDWVKEILGEHIENAEITLLMNNGTDLHSYQPTTDDMINISNCDMLVYVDGESDHWVEDAIKEANNKDMVVVSLMDVLGDDIKQEELIEGMEKDEHENDLLDDGLDEEQHEEAPVFDEHVWLSLQNAEKICDYIATKLGEIDPTNATNYTANANAYHAKLEALDESYENAIAQAKTKTILFGDRFPFRYLVDDYNLSYYAAFEGCSAETEASFETIAFLANKVDELGLHTVLTIDNANHNIAKTIVENTKEKNQEILSLNSMQNITSTDMENNVTYLSIMEDNLETLKTALN